MQDWLKEIADSTPVCDINLPGTHDSTARFVDFSYFARCQCKSITEQLHMGIRFFDLRAEADGNRIKLVHSVIDCRKSRFSRKRLYMEDVLAEFFAFLDAHPTETIMMLFKQDDGVVSPAATFDLFYERHIAGDKRFFTENRIPLLGEARGRIVLLNRCNSADCGEKYDDGSCGLNLANWPEQHDYYPDWEHDTPIRSLRQDKVENTFYLQDFYALSPRRKWETAVLPALKNGANHKGLALNYFSASNGVLSPKYYAKKMEKRFSAFFLKTGQKYGWLILDFPKEKTVERIIRSNRFPES